MNTCKDLIEILKPLSTLGLVVVAGGAVRDELLGRKPKDYDAFVLNPGWSIENLSEAIWETLYEEGENGRLEGVSEQSSDNGSSKWISGTFVFNERPVQVIASQCASLRELLDTFDWNACLFGVSDTEALQLADIGNICKGGFLKLHTVTNPLSTLRRGFRFCERYQMLIHEPDLVRLCGEVMAVKLQGESLDQEEHHSFVEF